MKQDFFEDIDSGWDKVISDIYTNAHSFSPECITNRDNLKFIKARCKNSYIEDECRLKSKDKLFLDLDKDLNVIPLVTFKDCINLKGIHLPESLISIGYAAFYGCEGFSGDLTIPDSVKSIGQFAFAECKGLTGTLKISSGVEFIGDASFRNCNFKKIEVSNECYAKYHYIFHDICSNVEII